MAEYGSEARRAEISRIEAEITKIKLYALTLGTDHAVAAALSIIVKLEAQRDALTKEEISETTRNITADVIGQMEQLENKPYSQMNVDPDNGVHYGYISQHDVSMENADIAGHEWTDLTYGEAVKEFRSAFVSLTAELLEDADLIAALREAENDSAANAIADEFDLRRQVAAHLSDYIYGKDDHKQIAGELVSALLNYPDAGTADSSLTLAELSKEIAGGLFDDWSDHFNDHYESDCSTYQYDGEAGYKVFYSNDSGDLIIELSPFYTMAAGCSPCFPNGGDTHKPGGLKTYALGFDWFDNYSPAPYAKLFNVADDSEVIRPADQTAARIASGDEDEEAADGDAA